MTTKRRKHPLRLVFAVGSLTIFNVFVIVPSGDCFKTDSTTKTVISDGSYADTAAAVSAVAAKNEDGWTVTIGAAGGSYKWPKMLEIVIPHVVTIQGASPTARPTITIDINTGFGIFLSTTEGKTITLKDMHFDSWKTGNGLILIDGGGDDCFRLTNLEFTNVTSACVWISSPTATNRKPGPYGLIDHCSLPAGGGFIFIRDNPAAVPNSWHRPMSWGTKHAVYIEDCSFLAPRPMMGAWNASDGDNGARFVIRHCTLINMPFGTHGADSQPLENGKNPNHSILQIEIMHNTFTVTDALDSFLFLRGGTATVFDNTINHTGQGFLNTMIKTAFYRATAGNGVCPVDRVYPGDYVGTQQPGCGVVDKPGQDPKNPGESWGSVPIYSWDNRLNLKVGYGEVGGNEWCQPNRDYFVGKARPGYTEFTYPHPLQNSGLQENRQGPPPKAEVTSTP